MASIGQPAFAKMSGWPMLAMNYPGWPEGRKGITGTLSGLDLFLPLLPIWPGFAINTLVYAEELYPKVVDDMTA